MASIAKFDTWQSTAGTTRGTILQALDFRSTAADKTVADPSEITVMSATITTAANSKLFVVYHTGQLGRSASQVNAKIRFTIDGVSAGNWDTNHYFYPETAWILIRPVFTMPWVSGALTAGSHTVAVIGGAYNGSVTYDYQTTGTPDRCSRLQIMEISG
jgi:hypothetical protein